VAREDNLDQNRAETYLAERVEQFFEQTPIMFGPESSWEKAFISFLTERREEIDNEGV